MESHYTYYSEYSIKSWISFLLNSEIKRPPYQRKFVWNLQKAYNLVKAVFEGNFIPPVVIAATQYDLGKKLDCTYVIPKGIYLVDGQQRLTSLLLFHLGIWPKEADENPPQANETDDESEEAGGNIDNPLDDLVATYKQSSSNNQHIDKLLESQRYVRLEDIPTNKDIVTTKLKGDIATLLTNIKAENSNLFLARCLGYSYVRSIGDETTEKKLFANLFRDINSTGQKLLPAESRQAMYYLEPSLTGFFDPDFLRPYKIGTSDIDFPRYLAYANELYEKFSSSGSTDIPSTSRIAYGYSSKQAEYILEYLTQAIDEDKAKSERFLNNMAKLKTSFISLFPNPDAAFDNTSIFELWSFGLIFWVLFHGKEVDTTQKSQLETELLSPTINTSQRIGGIRERLKQSIDAYQRVLKHA